MIILSLKIRSTNMQLFWEKKVRIIFSIVCIILSFSVFSPAEETTDSTQLNKPEEKEKLFGASIDLGYVGPNMWAGWQLSQGPCIQPLMKFSIGEFNIGMYMNFYGSEKDRDVNSSTGEGMTGKYKKRFGTCDEVQFLIDWSHDWKYFSLAASYWHLSYTWDNSRYSNTKDSTAKCVWFGPMSGGELTISPSVQLGPFSIFTDQNLVIIAKERKEEREIDTITKTSLWDYHGVFGVSWSKDASEKWSIDLQAKTEWASNKFIDPWLDSKIKKLLNERNIKPNGIYHITFGTSSTYNVLPQLSISANFNVEFITNYWVRMNGIYTTKSNKVCIPYVGLHATYSWNW
jgi:hypothetical protein